MFFRSSHGRSRGIPSLALMLVVLSSLIAKPASPSNSPTSPRRKPASSPTADHSDTVARRVPSSLASETKVTDSSQATGPDVNEVYRKLPLAFEANEGQADPQFKFVSHSLGQVTFLSATEPGFSVSRHAGGKKSESFRARKEAARKHKSAPVSVVRMKLLGSNPSSPLEGLNELPGKSSYFIGSDSKNWLTNIPSYAKARYKSLYNGIDAVFYGDQRQLEYDFVVAAGADPKIIRMAFEGVTHSRIDARGDLVLRIAGGEVRQRKPVIYQEVGGVRRYVEGGYRFLNHREIGFEIEKYDTSLSLIIDPILIYSSYLGGGVDEFGYGIAVDDFGNVYLAGETSSTDFLTKTPYQSQLANTGGVTDVFVTKLNASGSAVLYSTYLGGSNYDKAFAIAVDQSGNIAITGTTGSFDFPVRNAIQPTARPSINGAVEAFVTKLNPTGSALVFSTYLGGPGFDYGHGIAFDSDGNIYITGGAGPEWPTTVQAFQPGFVCCHEEAFITKLRPDGTEILYSTYLGGRDAEFGLAIAVDPAQNAYITGYTESAFDFPVRNALQPTYGGGVSDAFVARIPTINAPFAFALDRFDEENGAAPASSFTNFSNWSVVRGRVDLVSDFETGKGLFINLDGRPPQSTLIETKALLSLSPKTYRLRFDLQPINLGGEGSTRTLTVRLGSFFNETFSGSNLPVTSFSRTIIRDIQVPAQTSARLSFEYSDNQGFGAYLDNISLFEKTGGEYVTFLGGGGDESRIEGSLSSGIKVDSAGNAYVTGWTSSPDFPKVNPLQASLAGGKDVFVSKLNASGNGLVYSTYLGGSGDDSGNDLAIDSLGTVLVVGNTTSTNFPVRNAIQPNFGGEAQFSGDAFAAKLTTSGTSLVYSTYLGGQASDVAEGVAVDASGSALLIGFTGGDFPIVNSIQPRGGNSDAFFLKIPSVLGTGVPALFDFTPTTVGNSGIVTLQIRGENLDGLSASVKLVRGPNEIRALKVKIKGSSLITAIFDLTGAAAGQWDMVIELSDGHTQRLANAVTINPSSANAPPRIWIDLIGTRTARAGTKQSYIVVVGNGGNADAFQVPVWIRIPKAVLPTITIPLDHPPDPESGPIDWNTVPQQVETDSDSITPILIPYLPANSTRTIPLEVTTQGMQTFNVEVWANPPLLQSLSIQNPNLMMDCVVDLSNLVIEKILDKVLPVGCISELKKYLLEELIDRSLNALVETDEDRFTSFIQMIYGGASVAFECVKEFLPAKKLKAALEIVSSAANRAEIAATLTECVAAVFLKFVAPSDPNSITVVQSRDPNDKVGSSGAGPPRYVAGSEPLRYAIYFENIVTATAPAQEVTITDQLDQKLDWKTVNLGAITFGSHRLIPGDAVTVYATDVDLRPGTNLIVRVNASFDASTGQLTWKFFSLDPATGLPTTDPLAGFLPPNQHPSEGDGIVFFTVSPKQSLSTGDEISNSASIVFDNNPALPTPVWMNTLDKSKPSSHVLPRPATQNSAAINVQWAGSDAGSGIRDYTVYVSDNGGPFTAWLTETTSTQAAFNSAANHTYSFFSTARDFTGNTEDLKTVAEATTQIVPAANIVGKVSDGGGHGLSGVAMTLSGSRAATAQTDGTGDFSFSALPVGTYTVTPLKTNYTFTPPNLTFTGLSADQTANFTAMLNPGVPILVSEATSTRALAVDSVLWLRDPFQLNSPVPWGPDRRTRVMLFLMNFELLPGENTSVLTADAEDVAHRNYPLTVEYVGKVPGFDWLSCAVIRLSDDMGDLGDVLVRFRARGVSSNRVRLGIGHKGGGPPDDAGAMPTPGRQP